MKYSFVKGYYDGSNIVVLGRDEKGDKVSIKVTGFKPYFYVPTNVDVVSNGTPFLGIDDIPLKKVWAEDPREVPKLRTKYPRHYEADIKFVRRLLIDSGITCGFECEKKTITYTDLKPCNFSLPPKTAYLDIEVYSPKGFPSPERAEERVICVTVGCDEKYWTILLGEENRVETKEGWKILQVDNENKLLTNLKKLLKILDPDIVTGWRIDFDINYLNNRAKKLGLVLDFKPYDVFDLYHAYSSLYHAGGGLKDVVIREGIVRGVVASSFKSEWWMGNRRELLEYNKADVVYCFKLDQKLGLVKFFWTLKNLVGLEKLDRALFHGVLIDTLLLRHYKNKYILPSAPEKRDRVESYTGALVLAPPKGLEDNVGVFDMSRYYPNIMIALNLSPEGKGEVPKFLMRLMKLREGYDSELRKTIPESKEYEIIKAKRNSVKYLAEACVGYFGSPSSRLYDKNMAEKVTKLGREGLLFIKDCAEREGYKVIYADTDSIYIQIDFEKTKNFENYLNQKLREFAVQKGIGQKLSLKMDEYYKRILFAGVKKRYAGWCIWSSGREVEFIKITGFEYTRKDASKITRTLQRQFFEFLLKGEQKKALELVEGLITGIKKGAYDIGTIAIPKTLHKHPMLYGKNGKGVPDFVRGALYSNKHFGERIRGGDLIKLVYVKKIHGYPPTDVISFIDKDKLPLSQIEIDYDKMISRTVLMKIEDTFPLLGSGLSKLRGQKTLKEFLK